MSNSSRGEVVLIRYPFSDLSGSKIRPAVVVSAVHPSQDIMIVPLTSKTASLLPGEFILSEWKAAGLNVDSAVKRGLYTVHGNLVAKSVGFLSKADLEKLETSLRHWLAMVENPKGSE